MNKISILLSVFIILSCKHSSLEWKVSQGNVFGTTYTIQYEADKEFQNAFDSAFLAVNQSMSTYDSTSLISKLNRGEDVVLDTMFIEVFTKAKEYHQQTEGFLDPTIGDVVNAWGFGAKEKKERTPDSITIDSLMQFVGIQNITLKEGRLLKKYPQTYLEFNAFAKGYGLDVIAHILEEKGVQNYLIEIGGEIRCKGLSPKNKKWLIGIDKPIEDTTHGELSAKVALSNQSMATSGNYRKFYEDANGKKYVHTLDPHTGYPVQSTLLSTVVITSDCMTADAYATAFMAMGIEKVKKFLERNPSVEAMLLYANKQGEISIWKTQDFPLVE